MHSPVSYPLKPPRVLACVVCQQRKIKCDRQFPCTNCVKSRAQCVAAKPAQRQRRRRFPERALLDRLRNYEVLLRRNNVEFEPLQKDATREKGILNAQSEDDSDDKQPGTAGQMSSAPTTVVKSERDYEAKNLWHAMSEGFRDPGNESDSSYDDVREIEVRKALDQTSISDDHLFFGSRTTAVDISTLHPDPVQIFRLWQIYLDNVNPLLKVTHTPSLQGRIIEAASDVATVKPNLGALMFGIYCVSILSLTVKDCQVMFAAEKDDLLKRFQFGCQKALLNCGFLRSNDCDCLTALYLYLVSVRPSTDPQSLSSMLAVALRIARRMGIHSESALAKCAVVEAEIRRRLWWSLILFDYRVNEIALSNVTVLDPTWDCNNPLNVNDTDLRPEMKKPPAPQVSLTDTTFAVVRSELYDWIRHTEFYLDFLNPALKPLANRPHQGHAPGDKMEQIEELIETKYLKSCDQDNPFHFMTMWATRALLAKGHLLELHSRQSSPAARRTAAHVNAVTSYALRMLECDTKIMTSSLTKGYRWFSHLYFPFPAYLQIVQDLRRRPTKEQARRAWDAMNDNYEAWSFESQLNEDGAFFKIFARLILQAWEACEIASKQSGEAWTPPRVVLSVKHSLAKSTPQSQNAAAEEQGVDMGIGLDEFPMLTSMDFENQSLPFGMEMQNDYTGMSMDAYSGLPGQVSLDAQMNDLNWLLSGQPNLGG